MVRTSQVRHRHAKLSPFSRKLCIEKCEDRVLLVVGGTQVPINPPSPFDGVVLHASPFGSCTGSLLSTGRHILTASHCVDSFDAGNDPDPGANLV
jgi:Trypsin